MSHPQFDKQKINFSNKFYQQTLNQFLLSHPPKLNFTVLILVDQVIFENLKLLNLVN